MKNILERLREGVVIGDGGFVFALEKRGYVKAGPWSPEAVVENPEAVRQLHREFLRAGADVMQAFTFYASEDKLANRGNEAVNIGVDKINIAACELAREVANERKQEPALVAGGLSQTPTFLNTRNEALVKAEFIKQCNVFKDRVDFMIIEYFEHVQECIWALEVCKDIMPDMPVAANLCIGPEGDLDGVDAGTCAVRLAKAGADIVGVNCHFDPFTSLKTVEKMKHALQKAKLNPYLMCQPLAYWTQDVDKRGFIGCKDFPFGLESRTCTRWDIHKYTRMARDMGVKYIGGCCGFEPYHIRAITEELDRPTQKHLPWGGGLNMHTKPFVRERASKEYWENHVPGTGRV